ncbi:MAG: MBOAT family protein [Desulfovibrio sp.]|nr:MBOAT family protein [Desulfovibrio sp.]
MLFNSYGFIFLFLPLFLAFWQFGTPRAAGGQAFRHELILLVFSLAFYAFWGLAYLVLLICMICLNHFLGQALAWRKAGEADPAAASVPGISRRALFVCAVILNLLPLLWFKYSWFFIRNLALLFQADWQFTPPGLPLGISFYTFIQLAWLTGIYRGQFQPASLTRHVAFSSCFPYVISGPIVRYEQLGWQLDSLAPATATGLANGLTLFSLGLAKKVLLADSIGVYADAVFGAAEKHWPISGPEAWLGSLCYTFQLYFDFSGYTDMAIGLGLMIGLRLPENFNAPYRSTGIVDFWRRWHITLGSWLRDFLYIPLGGNRKGRLRQYCNLFLTMLIGGAWHGAGWTYILWGGLQGAMLAANHFFRASVRGSRAERCLALLPVRLVSIAFTFFCLNLCWVVFRAFSLDGALAIYRAMLGGWQPGHIRPDADFFGIWFPNHYFANWLPFALLATCAAVCWLLPTSRQFLAGAAWLKWRPTASWAAGMAGLAFASLVMLTRQSAFLYFQF